LRLCNYCNKNEGTIEDSAIKDGVKVNFVFCESCYKSILLSNITIQSAMEEKLSRIGKVCQSCGTTIEEFDKTMLFGCPDCYKYMREEAYKAAYKYQGSIMHIGKRKDG